MVDLAKYVRIYDPDPSDEVVGKRSSAVSAAVTQLKKINDPKGLVKLGAAAAGTFSAGIALDPLGSTVATAIKKSSAAFVREERELETSVLSAIAILELLDRSNAGSLVSTKDVVGAALWSALSFQNTLDNARLEELRQELLQNAADHSLSRAESSRARQLLTVVPEFADDDVAQIGKALTVANAAIASLTSNAALDREEIDILWWALGHRSPLAGVAYADMTPLVGGLVRGIELGVLLRRLPSRSHLNLALPGSQDNEQQSLEFVLQNIDGLRQSMLTKIPSQPLILECPSVFPLLSSIISGNPFDTSKSQSADEWCSRAVIESGLASLCANPVPRL